MSKHRSSSNSSGFFSAVVWLLIGLAAGIAIAAMVNRIDLFNDPSFISKAKQAEHLSQQIANSFKRPNIVATRELEEQDNKKPNFQFYNLLPESESSNASANETNETTEKNTSLSRSEKQENQNSELKSKSLASAEQQTLLPPKQYDTAAPADEEDNQILSQDSARTEGQQTLSQDQGSTTTSTMLSIPTNADAPVADLNSTTKEAMLKPESKATTNPKIANNYQLQVAALKKIAEAEHLRAELTLKGFTTQITSESKNGVTLHKVMVGPVADFAHAKKIQAALSEQHYQSFIQSSKG